MKDSPTCVYNSIQQALPNANGDYTDYEEEETEDKIFEILQKRFEELHCIHCIQMQLRTVINEQIHMVRQQLSAVSCFWSSTNMKNVTVTSSSIHTRNLLV